MSEGKQTFLQQIRDRHVLRTAVLYLGAAWVALEFIGFVVDNYSLHRALLDASLYVLTVGFVIALVIGWFHGGEGRQPVTARERGIVSVLAAVALLGTGMILSRDYPEQRSPTLAPAGIVPEDLGEGSLAVLPLTNRTGADSLDWLGPGLADMLTTNLAQLDGLRVVSAQRLLDLLRQAGRAETDEIPDDLALQVASQSGARALVRGSFIAVGDEVRLDVQLIDLEDGTVTAAERSLGSDVFALVDDVSAKLSGRMLGPAFTPTELTPVTQLATGNLQAYREYQEGLLAERRFLLEQAEGHYRRAVELDPEFAIAWLRLGMLGSVVGQEAMQAFQNADQFKDKASERDRYMIEAMFAANFRGDAEAADSLLRELIERFPEEKEARYQLGVFYDATGRDDEAIPIIEEAVTLDPFYAPGVNHLAYLAGRNGDTIGADTLSLKYLELEPGQANPHDSRGEILEMIGRNEEARVEFKAALDIEPGFIASYEHLARSYLREVDAAGARAALVPYLETGDVEAEVHVRRLMGDTHIADGSYDQALDAYAAAVERARAANRDDLSLQPLMEIGELATFMGEHERAEAAYREADAVDPLLGNVLFGLLINSGEAGRIDDMLAVRDTAMARFADLPPIAQNQVELVGLLIDALVAYYRGDAQASVQLFDEARELIGAKRPAGIGAPGQEALALIEAGRGREALPMSDMLEQTARYGNRMDPGRWHSALYIRGRAHEALGETDKAVEAYEELLAMIGDSAREISFWADAPDRLAALEEGAAETSG